MLRAKAARNRRGETKLASKLLSDTTTVGAIATIPIVVDAVNAANRAKPVRKLMDKTLGVHPDARLPTFDSRTARRRLKHLEADAANATPAGRTRGKVALFVTCYCNSSHPQSVEDLVAVLQHNGIAVQLVSREVCCGMPKFELGDLDAVAKYKETNIPVLAAAVRDGWDITAAIPSCVLMFRQELPLMFPDDEDVQLVKRHIFDPFEYLWQRHQAKILNTRSRMRSARSPGTRPATSACRISARRRATCSRSCRARKSASIERCSGHDGTYGVKSATYAIARKIAKPVENRIQQIAPDHFASDCPMAASHLAHGMGDRPAAESPISLLRYAYGI